MDNVDNPRLPDVVCDITPAVRHGVGPMLDAVSDGDNA